MNGLALVAALAVAQGVQAPDAGERRAEAPAAVKQPSPEGAAEPTTRHAEPAREPAAEAEAAATPVRRPLRRAATLPTAASTASPTATPSATGTSTRTPTATPTATATGSRPPPRIPQPVPEREEAERAARAFLDALVRCDAEALALASADRFSFDGDVQAGREPIRRTWRSLLAARAPSAAAPRVGGVEVLSATDATARFGNPPARVAPLARPGALVAVADVGGRTVVLFLAREGGRMAVLGMHD